MRRGNKITVDDINFNLTQSPLNIKTNHLSFLKDNIDKLSTVSNLHQYFVHLNLYWNYLNYTLLQVIIDNYGTDNLKQSMQSYASDMEQFEKETTVAEFIPHMRCHSFNRDSSEFTEMRSVINKPTSEYTLFEVEQLRRTFGQEFNLPRFALIFSGLGEGSVVLILLISIEMERYLCETVRDNRIKDIKLRELVISLSLGGKCVRARYVVT